ncbi:MAG: 3-phosphoshikimate 1-carboxyvinyltransferase, partial [Bacteroidota bacterium]
DRPAAIRKELIKIGIECELGNDYISITGGTIKGGETESHGDHRIAMMLAVLSLVSEKAIVIHDNHCVTKSWPGFWKIFLENKIK